MYASHNHHKLPATSQSPLRGYSSDAPQVVAVEGNSAAAMRIIEHRCDDLPCPLDRHLAVRAVGTGLGGVRVQSS